MGSPETTSEKAQRVAKETVGSASQTVKDATTKAHSQASDIAQDAQDAYNRQHGDSAYQKACSAPPGSPACWNIRLAMLPSRRLCQSFIASVSGIIATAD